MKLEDLQKTKSNSEIAKSLTDKKLWEFTQTPIGIGCPDNVVEFLKECSNEFSKRDIKLNAIGK
jgi:hypothetical protein